MKAALSDYDIWAAELLDLVSELHFRGFQRLRVSAGPSPSGHNWHLAITPASNIQISHGAKMVDNGQAVYYSTAQKGDLFGWRNLKDRSREALADRFIKTWPEVCAKAKGRDWAYVGWFAEMLRFAHDGLLPASFENWGNGPGPQGAAAWLASATTFAVTTHHRLPRPPGGEYENGRPIVLPTNPNHAINRARQGRCWGHA